MTVREIITRALQMLRVIASGETPTADELADGLISYNAMISGLRGHGVGPALRPMASQSGSAVIGGLHTDTTLVAPEDPFDGARFGVTGACSLSSDDDSTIANATEASVYFYRADQHAWIVEADASDLSDEPQFPASFHDGLAAMLALRLPGYGAEPSQAAVVLADECDSRLRARYRPRINPGCDSGVLLMSRQPWNRTFR